MAFVFGEVTNEAGVDGAGGGAAEAGVRVGGGAVGGEADEGGGANAIVGVSGAWSCGSRQGVEVEVVVVFHEATGWVE